jgi:putative transposase
LEFEGAKYHVINRGNYRGPIFGGEGAQQAFERCLFEACEKYGWLLHAFVLMTNHFHLALETPQANLVRGMQWLEATFANRFNRLRQEQGHLFQGRYRALIIGDDGALGQVCDYIHLNPIRANMVPIGELQDYRFCSYWYLHRPELRLPIFRIESALAEAGGIPDNPLGWESYRQRLAMEAAGTPAKSRKYLRLLSGWAIGSDAFRAAVITAHAPIGSARAWTVVPTRCVKHNGKLPCFAPWKSSAAHLPKLKPIQNPNRGSWPWPNGCTRASAPATTGSA